MILHAGLVALYDRSAWKGVLIEGPSGVGKSDLALRAISRGFRLVADDRVKLWMIGTRLFGAAPPPLCGLIEARGLGVVSAATRPFAEIHLIVQCIQPDDQIERMPQPMVRTLLHAARPVIGLRPLEASAIDKLTLALSLLGERA